MLKISKNASNTISQIFTIALFVAFVGLAISLPWLLRFYIGFFGKPECYFAPTLAIFYIALVPAFAAAISLFLLLRNVKREQIFTDSSVAYLRTLSWCCMAECPIFFALGFYYYTAFLISFVALFAGVILRVFKNVIEAAVEIKSENDFTI